MRGKKIIAGILSFVFIMGALAGCTDNTTDILGTVGETAIYRWYYNAYLLSQLEAYYRQTGVNLTTADKRNELKTYKQYRLNDLVGEFALREEARKQGFDKLTAEQEREIDLQYQEYYDNAMTGYMEEFGYDDAGRKKAEEAYMALLKRSSLTPERLRQNYRDQYVLNLFVASIIDQEPVSEDEILAYYDENKASEQKNAEEDPAWFGKNITDASIYIPDGYVDTMRITKKFNAAQAAKVNSAYQKYENAQSEYFSEILTNGEGETAKKLQEALIVAEEEMNVLIEEAYVELTADMEAIRSEVIAGADFIKTMELKSDDVRRISYFVSKESDHVEQSYIDAALSLNNVGDISEVVRLDDGVCIIMLAEKLTPGVRSYEEVHDAIKSKLQTSKSLSLQLDLMDEYAQKAEDDGIVTLYMDRL